MSARPRFQGDYMGFSYGTKADGTPMHSSDLGIVRVSDGSRFNENLLPTIQDKTVQIPGGDGTYYFGSYYTQRQFTIPFAFDDLSEEELANLKRHFGDKQVHDLIFDEAPYKTYRAKVTGTATIKYIPFAEGKNNRLYKGEGSIQFTCYEPFARCTFPITTSPKSLFDLNERPLRDVEKFRLKTAGVVKEYLKTIYPNVEEWWDASRIAQGGNFGDVPVPFLKIISTEDSVKGLSFGNIDWTYLDKAKKREDEVIRCLLNTKTGVVVRLDESGMPTNEIMNKYVTGNLTAKIPVGATVNETFGLEFTCLYV